MSFKNGIPQLSDNQDDTIYLRKTDGGGSGSISKILINKNLSLSKQSGELVVIGESSVASNTLITIDKV